MDPRVFEYCDVPPPFAAGNSPFHIKGQFYIQQLRALDRLDPGGAAVTRARLPPDLREFCEQRFLSAGWYDVLPLVRLAMFEAECRGEDCRELTRRQAERAAEHGMRGVYKRFIPLVLPQTVAMGWFGSRMVAGISQFYDFAPATVSEPSDSHTLTLERDGMPLCMLEWWSINATNYALTVLRLAGVKDLRGEYSYTTSPASGPVALGRVAISIRRPKK